MDRARVDAVLRMLVDSGDMTPMAVRQINAVLDAEAVGEWERWHDLALEIAPDVPDDLDQLWLEVISVLGDAVNGIPSAVEAAPALRDFVVSIALLQVGER